MKRNAVVLGISYDTPEANAAWAKKNEFPFELLSDAEAKVARAYGAFAPEHPRYPSRNTYVIGPDGKVAKVFEKVDPTKGPRQVLDFLAGV